MSSESLKFFNLTADDADLILDFQGRSCAICGKIPEPGKRPLAIDHDHKSGLIRGALCFRCNTIIGERLTLEMCQKILQYLLDPPATKALGAPRFGLPHRVGTKVRRRLFKKLQKKKFEKTIRSDNSNGGTDPCSSESAEPVV